MVKKRTPINLSQPIQPRGGELERLFATDGDVEQAAGLQQFAAVGAALQALPAALRPRAFDVFAGPDPSRGTGAAEAPQVHQRAQGRVEGAEKIR